MQQDEIAALAKLNKECNEIRKSCFSAMSHALSRTGIALRNTGYLTKEEAALGAFFMHFCALAN